MGEVEAEAAGVVEAEVEEEVVPAEREVGVGGWGRARGMLRGHDEYESTMTRTYF